MNYCSFTITFQLCEDIMSDDIFKLCFNSMLTTKLLYQKRPTINNTDRNTYPEAIADFLKEMTMCLHGVAHSQEYLLKSQAWQSNLFSMKHSGMFVNMRCWEKRRNIPATHVLHKKGPSNKTALAKMSKPAS